MYSQTMPGNGLKLLAALMVFQSSLALTEVLTELTVPRPLTPLDQLTAKIAVKVPGSNHHKKLWRAWSNLAIDHIRYHLSQSLPHPVNAEATLELEFQLGVAADVGQMPSFEDAGSRSGYALDFFCRARRLCELYASERKPDFFDVDNLIRSCEDGTCQVMSIGGGPGYDIIATQLRSTFLNGKTQVKGLVLDYEENWADIVDAMAYSAQHVLKAPNRLHCDFGKCDINLPLDKPANRLCREEVFQTDLFICQYCIAENAIQLRDSQYVFFRELFAEAKDGALFLFTETTHRLWPEFVNLVGNGGFQVGFSEGRGYQLVLKKEEGASISPEQILLCEDMRRDALRHRQKMKSGFSRQSRKIRGLK